MSFLYVKHFQSIFPGHVSNLLLGMPSECRYHFEYLYHRARFIPVLVNFFRIALVLVLRHFRYLSLHILGAGM